MKIETTYQHLWDAAKAYSSKSKRIVINTYLKKKFKQHNFIPQETRNEEQTNPKLPKGKN